jgi:hypothetical protein
MSYPDRATIAHNVRHFRELAAYWIGAAARERRIYAGAGLAAPWARAEHANCLDLARHCRSVAEGYAAQLAAL